MVANQISQIIEKGVRKKRININKLRTSEIKTQSTVDKNTIQEG